MAASYYGHKEVVQILIEHGADIHAIDDDGKYIIK